jgi:hypothetical protein
MMIADAEAVNGRHCRRSAWLTKKSRARKSPA